MNTLENIGAHLETISTDDWQPLFGLITEIEKTKEFGTVEGGDEIEPGVFQMPYAEPSRLVYDFEKLAYDLGIVIDFNWPGWDEGRELASPDNPELDKLDLVTCCMLITAFIRNNRFCDGALMDFFECGLALRILKRMETILN